MSRHINLGTLNDLKSNVISNSRIKVTSPDQFVPLWLANVNADSHLVKTAYIDHHETYLMKLDGLNLLGTNENPRQIYHSYTTEVGKRAYAESFKDSVNRAIKMMANWEVKEYTLFYNESTFSDHFIRASSPNDVVAMFYETSKSLDDNIIITTNGRWVAGTGLVALAPNRTITTINCSLYPATGMSLNFLENRYFQTQALIVVKAKYLPYLRVCRFLKRPPVLPYDAIKMLRSSTLSNTVIGAKIMAEYGKFVASGMDMMVEYRNSEEMNKYLFNPIKVPSAEAALKFVQNYTRGDLITC